MQVLSILSSVALVANTAHAWQYISPDALPSEDLSDSCKAALTVDIACARQVSSFFEREPVPRDSLEEACTSACRTSLSQFEASLKKDCGKEDTVQYSPELDPVHASVIATDLLYHFNRTCIKDGDRWCNVWAFENSPDNNPTVTRSVNFCDNCVIKPFQFIAGQSYSNGFDRQAEYTSLTKSCTKTNFPLATTAPPVSSSTPEPSPVCDGEVYTIKEGDTCQSISKANSLATAWMLSDNQLKAFCADFPKAGETICIKNKCKTYTIKADDTCQGIAVASKITMVQLYSWNPVLGAACNRMSMSVGDTVCIEPHDDEDYSPPTFESSVPEPEPTAAPVPSDIAQGTNRNCALYYSVRPGDYCNQIIVKHSISLADFLFLNQGLNAECTNLFAFESYCVAPVGPINQYPGHPDYVEPPTTASDIPFSELPEATFTPPPITDLPTYLPRAEGTRKDCLIYVNGTDLQYDTSWGFGLSACAEIAAPWDVTLEELHNWNPSLNVTAPDCKFSEDFSYCMAAYRKYNTYVPTTEPVPDPTSSPVESAPQPTTTSNEFPIRDGAADNCKKYFPVPSGMTCQETLDANGLTIAQFYAMQVESIFHVLHKTDCVGTRLSDPNAAISGQTTDTALQSRVVEQGYKAVIFVDDISNP
ncbi:hypothetical protein B0I35DRAFT_509996 [Stachybotrys elegans]|uniref:LysM domain-containing protein n=1 Tax=Stachybotrys elegans TaxID=80388 RepID=A0A8K0SW44_9HYPO|nr:hypothetical protein B0I35DRAFT_509996 [Stachybotrys elegans]